MVLIVAKYSEEVLFMHDCTAATPVDDLVSHLTTTQNLCSKIVRLESAIQDLILYGVYKHPAEHGLTEEQIEAISTATTQPMEGDQGHFSDTDTTSSLPVIQNDDGQSYLKRPDPTGRRVGLAPTPDRANTLRQTVETAKQLVQCGKTTAISAKQLLEQLDLIKAALVIAYPMGLPEFDPIQEMLDNAEDLEKIKDAFQPDQTSLWWAGKELHSGKLISDYLGKNEKTKVIIKMQKKGQGAPVREPVIDEKTQREMIAYYYKKQEENKRLMEDFNDDYYQTAQWTDPNTLKKAFNGLSSDVSWKPRR